MEAILQPDFLFKLFIFLGMRDDLFSRMRLEEAVPAASENKIYSCNNN
jgi:hypothetical protein